jgi:hypothetical protein
MSPLFALVAISNAVLFITIMMLDVGTTILATTMDHFNIVEFGWKQAQHHPTIDSNNEICKHFGANFWVLMDSCVYVLHPL